MSTRNTVADLLADGRRWLSRRDFKRYVLGSIVLTVVFLVIFPLVFLLWTSVWTGSPGEFQASLTLENYRKAYLTDLFDVSTLLYNSLTVAGVMTLVGAGFGLLFAWLLVRTNLPTKGEIEMILLSGQAVPGYIYAFMYMQAYNSETGTVSLLLEDLIGVGIPIHFATPWGAGFIVGISVIPTFYLLVVPALQDLDPMLEEVSRVSGASAAKTFRKVTLPLIKPALLSGAIVTLLYGLMEYSVVAMLAGRGQFHVYSTRIHNALRQQVFSPWGEISALVASIIPFMLVLVWYYRSVTRRKESYMTLSGQTGTIKTRELGRWRWPVATCLWVVLFVVWILPVLLMTLISLQGSWSGSINLAEFTLSHYVTAITDSGIRDAFFNSVYVAVGGATLGTVLVVGATYYTERTNGRFRGAVDFLMMTPLAVPGIIMGSALLFTALWLENIFPMVKLYGTLGIIIIGCVTVFLPIASRLAIGNIIQIHTELEEAGRVAGASWFQEMREIFLPLFRNTSIIIWFFLAIHIFQLLSIPAMTYTVDSVVIPIKLVRWYLYRPNLQLLSAVSTLFVFMTMLLIVALRYAGVTFYELENR